MGNQRWASETHNRARINPAEDFEVNELAERLVVDRQDVLDAIELVGDDRQRIEEVLRGRENSH